MSTEPELSLGEFLRHERESRGLTIEQIASTTKVGIRTLHALEADQYAELPAKPFVRGFVTSYCRFIGLDPKEVLSRFEKYMTLKATERPSREAGHSGYAFEKKDGEQQSRTILTIAMIFFMVIGGVIVIFVKPSFKNRSTSHIDQLRNAYTHGAATSTSKAASVEIANSSKNLDGVPPLPTPEVSPSPSPEVSKTPEIMDKAKEQKKDLEGEKGVEKSNSAKEDSSEAHHLIKPEKPVKSEKPEKLNDQAPVKPVESADVSLDLKKNKAQEKPAQEKPEKIQDLLSVLTSDVTTPEVPAIEAASKKIKSTSNDRPGSNPADPLDSGLGLKSAEIKHKIIAKMQDDTWVRYQVDDRPMRRFVVRKGKILVLRAKEKIGFQASRPDVVSLSYNNGGSNVLSHLKQASLRKGSQTVFFPSEYAEKEADLFLNETALPKSVPAAPERSSRAAERESNEPTTSP